jgi:hypothetical protein
MLHVDDGGWCDVVIGYRQCGPGIGFDFVPRSPLNSVQKPAKQVSGRSSLIANRESLQGGGQSATFFAAS